MQNQSSIARNFGKPLRSMHHDRRTPAKHSKIRAPLKLPARGRMLTKRATSWAKVPLQSWSLWGCYASSESRLCAIGLYRKENAIALLAEQEQERSRANRRMASRECVDGVDWAPFKNIQKSGFLRHDRVRCAHGWRREPWRPRSLSLDRASPRGGLLGGVPGFSTQRAQLL